MTLDEILQTFLDSSRVEWTDDLGPPTFLYGPPADIEDRQAHYGRIIYKPDIAISVAWGATVNDQYESDWLDRYPAKGPGRSFYIDLLYNGQVVYRELGVSVDGGRYTMPAGLANMENNEIVGWYCHREEYEFLAAFAEATGNARPFGTGFTISGMTIAE